MDIVCLHGAGSSSDIWRPQIDALESVSALDLPGHRGTPGPARSSVAEYAAWVDEQLRGRRPLALAGHSLGGAIALYLALSAQTPDWLAALILVGTGARLRVHPGIFALVDSDFDAAVEMVVDLSVADKSVTEACEVLRRDMKAAGPDVVRADYRAADGFDVMGRIAEIELPTLAIVGSDDRMTPTKYARYLCANISDSTLVMAPGAGHMVSQERPEIVSGAMREFRDELIKERSE